MLARDWPQVNNEILDANNAHPPMWLRVNRRCTSAHAYLQRLNDAGLVAHLSGCAPDAIRLEVPTDVRNLPDFSAGYVSVQDAAAQLAAPLLAPQPGDRVLDACAAPGGKTCHLLEVEPRIGELVALDVSSPRLRKVQENLARLNLQATLLVGDASDPDAWWDGRLFNRILLDVPCSATGVIRRHPDIKLLRRAADIDELAQRQAALLTQIWPLLAPGGRLLYASCSALRQENASVVAAFLKAHADARDCTAAELANRLPVACALTPYAGPGHAIAAGEAQMDGFYYACLDKSH
jgi:16S rRNA (cytosine967-C5)-methyltransferase